MKEDSGAGAHALADERLEVLGGVGQRRDALFASFDAGEALGHGREVPGGLEDGVGELDGQRGLHDDERALDLGAHRAGDVDAVGGVRVEEVAAFLFRARDLSEAVGVRGGAGSEAVGVAQGGELGRAGQVEVAVAGQGLVEEGAGGCLLYTSDAADE